MVADESVERIERAESVEGGGAAGSRPEKTAADAQRTALGLLARREHSVAELGEKLRRRSFPQRVIDDLMGSLVEANLVSDDRFAEAFVHARRQRGQGPYLIRRDLEARGVNAELIDQYLPGDREVWLEQAAALVAKKSPGVLPDRGAAWDRLARFLASKGYPTEVIYAVLQTPRG